MGSFFPLTDGALLFIIHIYLLEGAMSEEMMSTKEVAKYLSIHEKHVYLLIRAKKIPATRVTGKWLFPSFLI